MRKRKKVKFTDSAIASKKRMIPPNFDYGKTNEYKYFRELQEKTSREHQCSQISVSDHIKEPKARDNLEAWEKLVASKSQTLRSKSSDYEPPLTERFQVSSYKTSEGHAAYREGKTKCDEDRLLVPLSRVTPVAKRSSFSPFNDTSNSGMTSSPNYAVGSIFTDKRTKLLHVLNKSFSPGANKTILNKSGMLFELLQRLGINRKLEQIESRRKEVSNSSCQPHISSNPSFVKRLNHLQGIDLVTNATRRHFSKYDYSNEADEPTKLEWISNEIQHFPIGHSLEDGLHVKETQKKRWWLHEKESLDMHTDKTTILHWIPKFRPSEDEYDIQDSFSSEYLDTTNSYFYSTCQSLVPYYSDESLEPYFSDQSLVPYTKSRSWDFPPVYFRRHHMFSLPGFDENILEETNVNAAFNNLVPWEMNKPLALCAATNFTRQNAEHRIPEIFHSPPIRNYQMILQGSSSRSLDVFSPNPRHALELELNRLPISFACNQLSSSHANYQLIEQKIDSKFDLLANVNRFDGGKDDEKSLLSNITRAAYFSPPPFSSWSPDLDC